MGWKIIDRDGDWTTPNYRGIFLLDSKTDISSPPADNAKIAHGSIAYTADLMDIYQKANNGTWTRVGGG